MTDTKVTGSCLCGSVKYRVTGSAVRFYHCHCQRCRKTTGTGHASNLLIKPDSSLEDCLAWTEGEELLGRYKVPEAERFYNCFCTLCGSPMPRVVPELDAVIIPAGTLNDESPIKPGARIFWDSRADWSCEPGELPVFSEYPENSK